MQDLTTIAFGTAAGLALAGLLASAYALLVGRQLRFAFEDAGNSVELFVGIMMRVFAGPYLLARHAVDQVRGGDPSPLLVATLVAAACMWGCLSGIVVIDLLGGFGHTVADIPR